MRMDSAASTGSQADYPRPQDLPDHLQGVDALLHPRNVVLVGATDKPLNWAERIWNNLRKYSFAGNVFPMNPRYDQIWGVRCYRSFDDLPEPPDHIVVLVPAPLVADVLRKAAAAGARSATIVSSGFGEMGDAESQRLADELKMTISQTGLAVTGPNCLGNVSTDVRLITNIEERVVPMEPGPVAIAGQSGAIVMQMRQGLADRGISCSYMVTTGNQAGLTTTDLIHYFAYAPNVRVIVAYLEGITDTSAFLAACRAARAAGKPIVAIKLGASEGGRAAALAHTGSLAGSIESFDAVSREYGVVRVNGFDELFETTECFVNVGKLKGNRIAAISLSGGKRGLLIDAFFNGGLEFSPLGEQVSTKLADMLGPGNIVGNPLDAGFASNTKPSVYIDALKVMIDDPDTDLVLLDTEFPQTPNEGRERSLRMVNEFAAAAGKPVIYVNATSTGFTEFSRELRKANPHVAVMKGTDRAVKAIKALFDYAALDKIPPVVTSSSSEDARAELERTLAGAGGALDEVASKQLFAAYGIPVSQEAVAQSAEDAARIADDLGYPVVAKIVSKDILHKTETGCVILGIQSGAEVQAAFEEIMTKARRLEGNPGIDGVLIAQQISSDLELVIGGSLDPEMGPVVLFGTGGIDIELTRDVALAAAPLSREKARTLIARTKAGVKLAGYRGRPALHQDSVLDALVGISNLMVDARGRIASIDINPFLVNTTGGVAVDGLVVLESATAPKS
jgi:acetyltransferase